MKKYVRPPNLPNGGYNKGIVIELCCSCPPGCICGSSKPGQWYHSKCMCKSYINEYGDIFCQNFKDRPECDGYFIQNAKFQCEQSQKNKTFSQFRSAAQFLMAVAQGLQAAEFELGDNDMVHFSATLNQKIIERWNR